jgi:hypothetical protein
MQQGYSKLFDRMGIGTIDIGIIILILFILSIIFIVISILFVFKNVRLEKKLNQFMAGKDGLSLEENILSIHEENKYLKSCTDRNKKEIHTLYKKMEKTICKVGLVKYDAFPQMGGQLSFSLALLDEHNDGFIINSVHGTDGCYSYTKAINGGICKLTLGKEEEKALSIARQYNPETIQS